MGREAQRRAANAANRELRRGDDRLNQELIAEGYKGVLTGLAAPSLLLTCSACKREVFTLVEGECFRCHAPAEGKNLRDMTITQCNETHSCGIKNGRHVDGWDGNWLSCEEAARR